MKTYINFKHHLYSIFCCKTWSSSLQISLQVGIITSLKKLLFHLTLKRKNKSVCFFFFSNPNHSIFCCLTKILWNHVANLLCQKHTNKQLKINKTTGACTNFKITKHLFSFFHDFVKPCIMPRKTNNHLRLNFTGDSCNNFKMTKYLFNLSLVSSMWRICWPKLVVAQNLSRRPWQLLTILDTVFSMPFLYLRETYHLSTYGSFQNYWSFKEH